jgi:hypothetical protein
MRTHALGAGRTRRSDGDAEWGERRRDDTISVTL